MDKLITTFMQDHVLTVASHWLMSALIMVFVLAVIARFLIWFTVNCEFKFARQFEKTAKRFLLENSGSLEQSFHKLTKFLLEKTLYDFFQAKRIYKRRNLDYISSLTDRLFMFEDAGTRLKNDTLDQTRYLMKEQKTPRLVDIAKSSFERNHIFERIWGIVPTSLVNDFLAILPGLFIVAGIFGTFLGITQGLPELSSMDISQMDQTKAVLNTFLFKVSYSMMTSVLGIILSVAMTLINTTWSTEGLYFRAINIYTSALECIWHETTTNEVDAEDNPFLAAQTDEPPQLGEDQMSGPREGPAAQNQVPQRDKRVA